MDKYPHLMARHLNVRHELELQRESWTMLRELFGMHMAFDEKDGRVLRDRVVNFGHSIVAREHPDDYVRIDEDEELLDAVVTMADHYGHQLLAKLAGAWIAGD